MDLEVALAPVDLAAREERVRGHDALGDAPLPEGEHGIRRVVVELPARGARVAHQARDAGMHDGGAPLLQYGARRARGCVEGVEEVLAVTAEVPDLERVAVGLEALDAPAVLRTHRDRDLVVGDHDQQGQLPEARRVHRLVEVALGRGAIADDAHREAVLARELEPPRVACSLAELHAHRALHRHDSDLRPAQMHHHLAATGVGIGRPGERLTEVGLLEVGLLPQVGGHRGERVAPVVAEQPQVAWLVALLSDHAVERHGGRCAVHLLPWTADPELDAIAPRLHGHGGDDRCSRLEGHFVRLANLGRCQARPHLHRLGHRCPRLLVWRRYRGSHRFTPRV